jgi:L-aminopeptidase/D-esterase-like protein
MLDSSDTLSMTSNAPPNSEIPLPARRQASPAFSELHQGAITDVAGIEVGHFTDTRRPTGVTVVVVRDGAVAGVDVRGAAPGTRETDLLEPGNLVERINAIVLAGGSAFGLDAASGVMGWLEAQGIGLDVGVARVPIVPAAVLFDLQLGDSSIRPDAAAGRFACIAASSSPPTEGNVGAGAGATVGKLFGVCHAMKGGIGTASVTVGGVTVGALVAVNALGDVRDPGTARIVAGARSDEGTGFRDSCAALLRGEKAFSPLAGTNTTIGVIATDARLGKAEARRLAQVGHDGLARSIAPVHTTSDGDTLFAVATGRSDATPSSTLLGVMAAEAVARAVLRAVQAARGIEVDGRWIPSASDVDLR